MDLTHFLARLIGLYCIILSVVMFVRKLVIIEIAKQLVQNQPVYFILQILTLIAGLAMVLAHNVWSTGILALVVTLFGWLTLIRSVAWLFLPPQAVLRLMKTLKYEQNFTAYAIISLVTGVCLTLGGFAG
jgi:hypothetical protein